MRTMEDQLIRDVGSEHDRARLDQALADLVPEHSRTFFTRLIEEGRVRVDGRAVRKPSHRLAAGQRIEVDVPRPRPALAVSQDIPLSILYEDAEIVVVDKPPGLVVHPAAGHADSTLVNALLHHVRDLSGVGGALRPGIVHRLDKDTSGVMVVAKNDAAHRALAASWKAVRKEYLAVVYGTPKPERATIDAPVGRDPRNRKRMAVVRGARAALTDYDVVESLPFVSLVHCVLRTGRTHQIRVHLKHLGHPIVGDVLYSGPQWRGIPDPRVRKLVAAFPRQALHAWKITLPDGRKFEAPLPADLEQMLRALRG